MHEGGGGGGYRSQRPGSGGVSHGGGGSNFTGGASGGGGGSFGSASATSPGTQTGGNVLTGSGSRSGGEHRGGGGGNYFGGGGDNGSRGTAGSNNNSGLAGAVANGRRVAPAAASGANGSGGNGGSNFGGGTPPNAAAGFRGGGGGAGSAQPPGPHPSSHGVSPSTVTPPSQNDPLAAFPHAPYQPFHSLQMAAAIQRHVLQAPASGETEIVVASSKFAHLKSVFTLEKETVVSALAAGIFAAESLTPAANGGGAATMCYRSVNRFNGKQVLLRRLVQTKATVAASAAIGEMYRQFRHPCLVPLHSVTHTTEFALGSVDIIAEYRWVRGATRVSDLGASAASSSSVATITEATLWSMACQLVGLILHFHNSGTALRGLHISKLLFVEITGRVMLAGVGMLDLLEASITGRTPAGLLACSHMTDAVGSIQAAERSTLQQRLFREDLQALGLVLTQLVTRTTNPNATLADASGHHAAVAISPSMTNLITALREGSYRVSEICRGLGERLASEVGHQAATADYILSEAAKEVHNGRLLSLLMKLNVASGVLAHHHHLGGSIGEYDMVALRLFAQYLFDQVDEDGAPRHDLGHIYFALNKLDSASEDVIQLIGLDNDTTVLVVSFKELKTSLERACAATLEQPPATAAALSAAVSGGAGGSSPPPVGAASPLDGGRTSGLLGATSYAAASATTSASSGRGMMHHYVHAPAFSGGAVASSSQAGGGGATGEMGAAFGTATPSVHVGLSGISP